MSVPKEEKQFGVTKVTQKLCKKIVRFKSGSTLAVFSDATSEFHDIGLNRVVYRKYSSLDNALKDSERYKMVESSIETAKRQFGLLGQHNDYNPTCAICLYYCLDTILYTKNNNPLQMEEFLRGGFSEQQVKDTTKIVAQKLFTEGEIVKAAILYHFLAKNGDLTSQWWLVAVAKCGLTALEDRTF